MTPKRIGSAMSASFRMRQMEPQGRVDVLRVRVMKNSGRPMGGRAFLTGPV